VILYGLEGLFDFGGGQRDTLPAGAVDNHVAYCSAMSGLDMRATILRPARIKQVRSRSWTVIFDRALQAPGTVFAVLMLPPQYQQGGSR
jgi:hypothetical protein